MNCNRSIQTRATRWSATWLLIAAAMFAGGCEGASFLAEAFVGRTVKAVYKIEDRPTLVLVDDPKMLLGDRSMPLTIASAIGFELQQEEVVAEIIPLEKLVEFASSQGEAYEQMPVSRIGKELGAKQVIHVNIEKAEFGGDPGILKPEAAAQIKLIDGESGERLFPPGESGDVTNNPTMATPGYMVVTKLWYRTEDQQGPTAAIRRKLADQLARDIARLFHDYHPRQTGQPYDD